MLSDLDQRQAAPLASDNESEPHISVPFTPVKPSSTAPIIKIIFYTLVILLLSVTSYYSYHIYNNNSAAMPVATATVKNKPITTIITKPIVVTKPTPPVKRIKPISVTRTVQKETNITNKVAAISTNNNEIINDNENMSLINNDSVDTSVNKTTLQLRPAQQAEVAYQKGYQLLQQNKVYSAESKLLLALEHDAKHIKAREVLVGLYLKTGRKVEATDILNKGILHLPRYTNFKKLAARLLLDNNQTAKAVQLLLRNKPAMAADLNYFALLAASYQRNKNHAAAANTYVQLLKIKPREGIWWVGMAVSLEALNKNKEALEAYEKARQTGTLNTRVSNYSSQRLKQLTVTAEP